MENIGSYILYLGVFAASTYGSWIYSKRDAEDMRWYQKLFYFMMIALPVILMQGLRFGVGTDYWHYVNRSYGAGNGVEYYVDAYWKREPLFFLFTAISYTISGGNQYFYFMADAIVMNTLVFLTFDYFRQYEENMSMPVLYFMYYFLCFPYFLNIERQGMACVIAWFSMRYVFQRKPLRFVLCILCAFLVHNTAIICLLLYPAYLIFTNENWIGFRYLITATSLVIPILLNIEASFASELNLLKYTGYVNHPTGLQININWVYATFLVIVLCLFLRILREARANYWYILFLVILMLSMYWLIIFDNVVERMALYFEIALIYGYAYVQGNLQTKRNKEFMNLFLICLMLFHFTVKFYIVGKADLFPYQTILMQEGK